MTRVHVPGFVTATAAYCEATSDRTGVEGMVVPYNEIGYAKIDGVPRALVIEPGGLEWAEPNDVILTVEHGGPAAGRAVALASGPGGIAGVFRCADTTTGRDAVVEAAEDFRAGLSMEADLPDPIAPTGTIRVTAANPGIIRKVALVETPAFKTARVHRAAAAHAEGATTAAPSPAPATPAPPRAEAAEVPDADLAAAISSLTEVVSTLNASLTPADPEAAPAADEPAAAAAAYAAPAPAPARNPSLHAGGAPVVTGAALPTPGEYMRAFCAAALENDAEPLRRMRAAVSRVEAASVWAADQVTSDTAGLIPTPIIGEVVKNIDASRPMLAGCRGPLPMPAAGASFKRPRVTQHTTVGTQANQLEALPSQKMTVVGDTVSKVTKGGYVQLSEQDVDWTDPGALELLLGDLADIYARDTDNYVADQLVATLTGSSQGAALDSTADVFILGVATAAATSYAASGLLPDTLYCTPAVWASLVSLVDDANRPIFPNAGPSNAIGVSSGVTSFEGNPLNLNMVVDANFASGTAIVGSSQKYEFYEQNKGAAQIAAPSIMGVTAAYRGYIGVYNAAPASFIPLDVTA